jgi:MFS transporter, DHA1 family, inner membrane transport protein
MITRSRLALGALALGAFVIGTAELVIVGILNLVAGGLSVSVSTAGLLVTAYALGISIGGPVVGALTVRVGRQLLLCMALGCYVAGNLLAAFATDIGMAVVARVLTGTVHGLFIGVASMVATTLVPAERRGRAMSTVFGGIAVATVLGVPLGTVVGQAFGWRATFGAVVVLGAVALVATIAFVPAVPHTGTGRLGASARAAFAPRVLAMLGVGMLLVGGQFTAYTYLTPYLEHVTGVSGRWVSGFLLVYGIACAAGTMVGGRLADRGPNGALLAAGGVLVLAFGALYLAGGSPVPVVLVLAAWGFAGLGLVPSFQLRVIGLAGAGADLAATLGASAVNAGIAAGAALGGAAVAGHGVRTTALLAGLICAAAVPATWASRFLTVPAGTARAVPETVETVEEHA